jgi:hypothetical protein
MTLPPEPEPIMEAANNEQQQKFCFVEEIPEAEEKPTKGIIVSLMQYAPLRRVP